MDGSGLGLDGCGAGMDGSGFCTDGSGRGMDSPYLRMNSSYAGMDGSYQGTDSPYARMDSPYARTDGPNARTDGSYAGTSVSTRRPSHPYGRFNRPYLRPRDGNRSRRGGILLRMLPPGGPDDPRGVRRAQARAGGAAPGRRSLDERRPSGSHADAGGSLAEHRGRRRAAADPGRAGARPEAEARTIQPA